MQNRKKLIEEIGGHFISLKRRLMVDNLHHHKNHITPSQVQVLMMVHRHDGITTSEIAKKLNISNSAATQLIEALVGRGHLLRECCDQDRRTYKIRLTEESKKHSIEMKKIALQQLTAIFEALSDHELEIYHQLNKKIISSDITSQKET